MTTVEIIAIGNEILLGDVLDTNTHWLCRKLTGLGGHVRQAVQVRDDKDAIVYALGAALERGTELIITTGGLGPTEDDLTLEAVATALDRPLLTHPKAYAWVASKYQQLAETGFVQDAAMTVPRAKMARLPQGAMPVANPAGAAPGVVIELDRSIVICLPGVPAEMKSIFEETLQPILRRFFRESVFAEKLLIVGCQDESVLAPILGAVGRQHPHVYVKSRAKHFGPDVKFRVILSATGFSRQEVASALEAAQTDLEAALAKMGIAVETAEAI